jgi:hypothetical protein
MVILVLGKVACLTLWKEGVITVVSEVVAPVEVVAGAGALVRAHTDHAAPAAVGAEANPQHRTIDMCHEVLLVLVHPTVLAVEAYLQMGWTSTLRIRHNVL